MPIFPKGGPDSPRDGVAEKERRVTCIIPPMVSPSQRWYVVQHKKNSPKAIHDSEKEDAEAKSR